VADTPLSDRLAELDQAVEEARAERGRAKDRRKHETRLTAKEATADLMKFRDDIAMRKPGAVPEADRLARARELTHGLLSIMEERGLIFEAFGPRGGALMVVDPSISDDERNAEAALVAARQARSEFASENADALEAEAKAAEAQAIREALDGDDPDAIREALNPTTNAALTTDDLSATRERVTAGA
jgi:hypothetical protein